MNDEQKTELLEIANELSRKYHSECLSSSECWDMARRIRNICSGYKLKPCPFCGGKALVLTKEEFVVGGIEYCSHIECGECGSEGETFESKSEIEAEENAVAAWNKRENECDITELVSISDEIIESGLEWCNDWGTRIIEACGLKG